MGGFERSSPQFQLFGFLELLPHDHNAAERMQADEHHFVLYRVFGHRDHTAEQRLRSGVVQLLKEHRALNSSRIRQSATALSSFSLAGRAMFEGFYGFIDQTLPSEPVG